MPFADNRLDALIKRIVDEAANGPRNRDAERLLLTDFLVCVAGSADAIGDASWGNDGTAGYAATLAVRAHVRDHDDIHWASGIHPGAIIWPVVVAVGSEVRADGAAAAVAARVGYVAMVAMAQLLGPEHARLWHATATCGAFGAAAAAATLLGLEPDQMFWACSHALAVAGGVGQAVLERSATTAFHRGAATVVGIQAARLAQAGLRSSTNVLDGERGALAVLGRGEARSAQLDVGDAFEATSVRLYPVNGFAQAAVEIAANLRRRAGSADAVSLTVEVSDAVAAATTGTPGGHWWDLRGAVAAAWTTADPFSLTPSDESSQLRDRVQVQGGLAAATTTRVTVRTATGELCEQSDTPPGFRLTDPGLPALLDRKWDQVIGQPGDGLQLLKQAAGTVLSEGPRLGNLGALLRLGPTLSTSTDRR